MSIKDSKIESIRGMSYIEFIEGKKMIKLYSFILILYIIIKKSIYKVLGKHYSTVVLLAI